MTARRILSTAIRNLPRLLAGACAIALSAAGVHAAEPWITLANCRYVPNPSDDGDSFHVSAAGKEYIFRLYFVDTPETDAGLSERIDEQAKYFGLKKAQVIELGELAKQFTREKLSGAFKIRTCMQDALGRSKLERFYAFVETDSGDLGEQLVANGMARLHGTTAHPPGAVAVQAEMQKLQRLEREAKQQKVGGWGAANGRLNARLQKAAGQPTADSFSAFFHPEQAAAPTSSPQPVRTLQPAAAPTAPTPASTPAHVVPLGGAVPGSAPSAAPATAGAKLNVNTATAEQLDALPGIGPTLAQRIIAARPFTNADGLQNVKGIGAAKYEKIRPFFE
jgi:competence protein ComEA